ncbi:MAG: hypothetical protein AAFR51_08650 [Pseudomonadota bacterium]
MRNVLISAILAFSLAGCATVSMVASEALVETDLASEDTSLRKVSDAYTDLAERKNWVEKSAGILGFARMLMDGSDDRDQGSDLVYLENVQNTSADIKAQLDLIRADIEGAAHGLDVATMEAEKLFETERSAKTLRADLVSYESALVTAKKARRTFVTTLTELAMADANPTTYALAEFDNSIDAANDAADKLADFAANRKKTEAAAS